MTSRRLVLALRAKPWLRRRQRWTFYSRLSPIWVGISEIAERVSMTYQGVVNRLKALELRLDGPDMAQRIRIRMEEERSQLQPYTDWLKHCLQLG